MYVLPPSSVKNILYGRSSDPKILTIKKICDGLDITLAEFFSTPEFDALEQEIKLSSTCTIYFLPRDELPKNSTIFSRPNFFYRDFA